MVGHFSCVEGLGEGIFWVCGGWVDIYHGKVAGEWRYILGGCGRVVVDEGIFWVNEDGKVLAVVSWGSGGSHSF